MEYVEAIRKVQELKAHQEAAADGVQLVESYKMDKLFLGDTDRVAAYLSATVGALSLMRKEGKKVDAPLRYARSLLTRFRSQDESSRRLSLEGLNHLLKKSFSVKSESGGDVGQSISIDLTKYQALVGSGMLRVGAYVVEVCSAELEVKQNDQVWVFRLEGGTLHAPDPDGMRALRFVTRELELVLSDSVERKKVSC